MILIDTSAFLAVLNANDIGHQAAKKIWLSLLENETALYCNSYILLETLALLQKRIGMGAVKDFHEHVKPFLQIEWMMENEHKTAMQWLLSANRRRLSLVDCASFATMRRLGIHTAFTFDPHFAGQGFEVVPG